MSIKLYNWNRCPASAAKNAKTNAINFYTASFANVRHRSVNYLAPILLFFFFLRNFCRCKGDKASIRIWMNTQCTQLIRIILMRTLCIEWNWIRIIWLFGSHRFTNSAIPSSKPIEWDFIQYIYGIEIAFFGYRSKHRRKCGKNKVDKNGNISLASTIIRFICSQFVFGASILPATRHHLLNSHYAWNNANAQANANNKNDVGIGMHVKVDVSVVSSVIVKLQYFHICWLFFHFYIIFFRI